MFFRLLVSSVEYALVTLEATRVINMRLQTNEGGDHGPQAAGLIISEKIRESAQAQADALNDMSDAVICANLRSIIQANEIGLAALRLGNQQA